MIERGTWQQVSQHPVSRHLVSSDWDEGPLANTISGWNGNFSPGMGSQWQRFVRMEPNESLSTAESAVSQTREIQTQSSDAAGTVLPSVAVSDCAPSSAPLKDIAQSIPEELPPKLLNTSDQSRQTDIRNKVSVSMHSLMRTAIELRGNILFLLLLLNLAPPFPDFWGLANAMLAPLLLRPF